MHSEEYAEPLGHAMSTVWRHRTAVNCDNAEVSKIHRRQNTSAIAALAELVTLEWSVRAEELLNTLLGCDGYEHSMHTIFYSKTWVTSPQS